jgi:hypothetical protein
MKAVMRIAPLLLGLGVGEVFAEESPDQEDGRSPIFVVRVPAAPALPAATPPPQTEVTRQLTELIRRDAGERVTPAVPAAEPADHAGEVLHLEKMTVEVKKVIVLPGRETPLQKFTRTGHLWEFSPTKRFMVGPHGDKVGLMFSFDW